MSGNHPNQMSPRQRMINMMYLVLTALLALNVSKEVLNSLSLFLGMEIPNWPPDNIAELSKKLEENV